ncbi:MAG: hypothetical protein HYR68_15035 [Burkholderiales bacterium]|nr:hypothetical protein [Burkholderiales bacterium]MBI3729580.1 hypothetical protein [Burkholderiales bacterium]
MTNSQRTSFLVAIYNGSFHHGYYSNLLKIWFLEKISSPATGTIDLHINSGLHQASPEQ